MTAKDKSLQTEFEEFLACDEIAPSITVQESVTTFVVRDLNPSLISVLLKVLGIHAIVSLFSLSICSQFGIQTFRVYDAMETMMSIAGPTYCMAFCGLLYLSLSGLMLSFVLRPEDISVIRKHRFLQVSILTGASLGVFLCLGATVLFMPAMLWIAGSFAGALISLEIGWFVRSIFRKQLVFGN